MMSTHPDTRDSTLPGLLETVHADWAVAVEDWPAMRRRATERIARDAEAHELVGGPRRRGGDIRAGACLMMEQEAPPVQAPTRVMIGQLRRRRAIAPRALSGDAPLR